MAIVKELFTDDGATGSVVPEDLCRTVGMVQAWAELPGWEIVDVGLRDLALRRRTIAALVVSIGAPRLRQLGFEVVSPIDDAEHALYQALAVEDPDAAHGRYNALVRRLVSFERAAACAG